MPIFEYKCRQCGTVTEFLEKRDARGPHTCGKCASTSTEKVLSTFSAHATAAVPASCPSGGCSDGSCPTGQCPYA